MKAKLKVKELVKLEKKGFVLKFITQFGEELGCFYNSDTDEKLILQRYPINSIDIFNIVPYRSNNGSLGISVEAPLKNDIVKELF